MPSSGVQTCALRSEEHTSELQSLTNLVCRLLLEKNDMKFPGEGISELFYLVFRAGQVSFVKSHHARLLKKPGLIKFHLFPQRHKCFVAGFSVVSENVYKKEQHFGPFRMAQEPESQPFSLVGFFYDSRHIRENDLLSPYLCYAEVRLERCERIVPDARRHRRYFS